MKSFLRLTSLIVTLLTFGLGQTIAQQMQYTSRTGLTLMVPDGAKQIQDNIDLICVETPDELYTFTAVPFNMATTSELDLKANLAQLAKSAQIDYEKAELLESCTETMDISLHIANYNGGGGTFVGYATVRNTTLSFYLCLVASKKYGEYGGIAIQTLEFLPNGR